MNSYFFRLYVKKGGSELLDLNKYSDFLYFLKNLKYNRKDAELDPHFMIPKNVKNSWFPLVLCANWGSPHTYQEANRLFNYIVNLNYAEHFYLESILERENWRVNGKNDIYCIIHYKADMCMDTIIQEILNLWNLTIDYSE